MKRSVRFLGLLHCRAAFPGVCAVCGEPARMTVIDRALDRPIGPCCVDVSVDAAVALYQVGLAMPDVECILAKVADLQWTLEQMRADHAARARENDEHIALLRAPFLAEQQRLDESINALEKTISAHVGQVKEWALVNPQRFEKPRSLELLCATIGFRLTPPRVETLKDWTFGVCAVALSKLPWGKKYLKAPVVDKDGLLRDRDLLATEPAKLAAVGLRITQTDEFYVELKREHTDNVAGRIAA